MSQHPTKANRLSKQNYCTFCEHRVKDDKGTWCALTGQSIEEAMKNCYLLKPFDRYKEVKAKK